MAKDDDKKKLGVVVGNKKEVAACKKELRDPMFVGIDPSYNSFGIIVIDQNGELIEQKLLKSTIKAEPEDRIMELEKAFEFIPNIICLHSVYMEGPSYSSDGAYMLQMGALHYYLRIFFRKNNVEYKVIAPGTLKKFVTGKGNCKKNLILMKTFQKWGVEFEVDDLADAFGLAQMALDDYKNQ
jgi:crossover junction endodeoxyribonuclease RuvC